MAKSLLLRAAGAASGLRPGRGRGRGRVRRLAVPFLAGSPPWPLAVALAALALGLAIGWGFAALALHEQGLAVLARGGSPGPVGSLFASGASALTAWPGWATALVVGLASLRLRRSGIAPPASRHPGAETTAAELRAGLRREYRAVRWALVAVAELALADCARVAVSGLGQLAGVPGAAGGLPWMGAEAAGLVVASLALVAWLQGFRVQLERVGAIAPRPP